MQIEIPFNFINLLAFLTILKYENKRSIKIETLQKYHETLLEELIKDYNNKDHIYYDENDKWEGKIEFFVDESSSLENFLNEFSHLFNIKGDTIYLYDEIEYDEIMQEVVTMREEQKISARFESVSDNSSLLDVLNITKIKTVLEKYIKIEKEIEKTYSDLNRNDNNEDIKEKLKKLLFMRAIFLNNICQNPDYVIDAFRLESLRIHLANSNYEYINPPIDLDLWKKSKYYKKAEEYGDIDDRIYDIYQYAIFGKTSLAVQKNNEMLTNLCFFGESPKNQFEQTADYFGDDSLLDYDIDNDNTYYIANTEETDLVFYLKYLHKLDEYMLKYGQTSELIETKNRLLYALDMPKLCLYKEENFIKELEESKEIEIDEEDYDFIEDEVRFMTDEIFMVEYNINTIKKLLFISTYYELTHDKKIVKILNKHSSNKNFVLYSEIIFGNEKGFTRKLFKK